MGKLNDYISLNNQALTKIGEDIRSLRESNHSESDAIKTVAVNQTAMFYAPTGRGNILYASVGSYYIPKTTADSRVIYRGDARWSIETGQGLSGNQILIIEPEYGDLVLASVEIPIDSAKEYSLEFDYQLEFRGDPQSNVIISGIVKIFSESEKTFSANIIGIPYSTKIPDVGDRIFKITAETDSVDRIYGALGGSLIKIYSEEEGADDPDPPPSFDLEDFKRNTIHPNFSPVQSTVTMYENIPYGDHPLENFDIFLPNGKNNCPVVIFIHGGGFSSYSKTEGYGPRTGIDQTWQIHEDAMYFLNQDIAYASINYPLIDLQNPEDGPRMKEIFDRIDYCIQFMKYHSSTLRINKNKFILTGISAGPTYAMYSHFSPDRVNPTSSDLIERESPKPFTIAGRYTGVTEDIEIWEDEIFNHIGLDVRAAFNSLPNAQKQMILAQNKALYGFDSLDDFYTLQGKNILNLTNGVRFLNPNIEEFWLANYYTQIANDLQILGHHGLQAKWLHEKADAAGTPHIIFYGDQSHGNETFRDFITRKMSE